MAKAQDTHDREHDVVIGTYYLRGMRMDVRTDARRWIGGRPQYQIDLLINGMQFWVASLLGSPRPYQVLSNTLGRALREYDASGTYPEVTPESARELRRQLYEVLRQEFELEGETVSRYNGNEESAP
jgi:hypothetical protein